MSLGIIYKNPRFIPFFWTQFFGAVNDNCFKNALAVIITYRGIQIAGMEPNAIVAMATGIFIFPFFLFSATAGQLADKYEKSFLIRLTKWSELMVMAVASFGFFTENFVLLLMALFFMGAQSAVFGPLKYGIIPNLVKESELVSANAYVEIGTYLAILLGTVAGGIASGITDFELIITIGILLVAALGIVSSWFIPATQINSPELKVDWTILKPTWEIISYILPNRPILNTILGISWFWFLGAGMLAVMPAFSKDTLHAGEQVVTAFLALFTVGIAVGGILCERLSFKRVEIGLIPFGSIGMSIFLIDLWLAGNAWAPFTAESARFQILDLVSRAGGWRILADLLLIAFFGGLFIVPLYAFLQYRGEQKHLARIIAGNNIISAMFMVASAGFVALLFVLDVKVPEIFLILSLVNIGVAVYIYSLVPEFTLRFLSWMLAHMLYRIRVEGEENLPEEGAVVLVCNHVSYVDWLIVFGVCKRPVRFVMDYQIFSTPLVKHLCRHAKVIPVAPAKENLQVMESAFAKVSEELDAGQVVGIFPEGWLTRKGKLGLFRPGIERIVKTDPVPVVPMALFGLWGSVFTRSEDKRIFKAPGRWRRQLILKIGKPVPAANVTALALEKQVDAYLDEAATMAAGMGRVFDTSRTAAG